MRPKRAAAKRSRVAKKTPSRRGAPRPPTAIEREAARVDPLPVVCNERELAFIDEWMGPARFNGCRAMLALKPDYTPGAAAVRASEWLSRPHVMAEITSRREERRRQIEAATERLLEEQMHVALASISDVMDWDERTASYKPRASLTAEQLAAIAEVTFQRGNRLTVKMHDKLRAIEALQKQLSPTPQERRRMGTTGEEGGVTIIVEGGPTGIEVTVREA